MNMKKFMLLGVLIVAVVASVGCSKSDGGKNQATGANAKPEVTAAVSAHGEWWCGEHGVPEEVCAQCDKSLVADFKTKGDWCEKHERPESQCFICHPEKEAEFAALYEAKYGKKLAKPTVGEEESEHQKEKS